MSKFDTMGKVKKYELTFDEEQPFEIYGISSAFADYRLTWELNQVLGIHLEKTENSFEVFIPKTKSNHGELLRTIGFSSAPGLIRVFGIIPNLVNIAFIAAAIWMLVAMVIAVRQALDYKSTWRAVGVVVTGFLIQSVVLFMMLKLF